MPDSPKHESVHHMNLDSSLSSLLRSLYLHGVEHCALVAGACCSVYSKEQIVSILERGYGEKKVRDALVQLESNSSSALLEKNILEPLTPVLIVTDMGAEVVSVERLPEGAPANTSETSRKPDIGGKEELLPSWWEVPLPLVAYIERKPVLNPCAGNLLGDIVPPSLPRKGKRIKEFLMEFPASKGKRKKTKRQFLFTEISPSVFRVEDVTEELRTAEEMAWWASVGQAFVSRLKGKGKGVRHLRSPEEDPVEVGTGERLACIWEEKLLGYVCIDDEQTE